MNTQGNYIENDKLADSAESKARLSKPTGFVPVKQLVRRLNSAMQDIRSAYDTVSRRFGSAVTVPVACEWLLDNCYLAQREGKNAENALLAEKHLRSSQDGVILTELCLSLVNSGRGTVNDERCRLYLSGYQRFSVLPRKELYLFPAALRYALILRLSELVSELITTSEPEDFSSEIANLFTSLRYAASADMQSLLESVDVTEAVLMSDPAGIYPEMDDTSRALYRERLAELAKHNSMDEPGLARHILKLCRDSDGEARHMGYHLFSKPVGEREKRRSGAIYIASNVLVTMFLTLLCGFLSRSVIAALLLLLPISELTKSLLDYIILLSSKPARLPRLALDKGVPEEGKTVCVISALLSDKDSGPKLARRLEEFSLADRRCGKNLTFGILADLPEALTAVTGADSALISSAVRAIDTLNEKYGGGFYLFTRSRTEDYSRGKFCGFERKRGAVKALAEILCDKNSELRISAGDAEALRGTKYIITLDSDTNPTPESLRELIGAIMHPLNRPVLDRDNACVTAGHGIIHPRMSCGLASAGATDFSRIFAGIGGTEPYSSICGELYMDLFDRGGFSGKGIIDAEALLLCTESHIPDGTVLSHDALEGAYLRGGYLSDTEFTDSFPSSPIAYYRRSHRWIRGDWQNSGWIFRRDSGLPDIERWKLFDSLRRSLVAPLTFVSIFLGLLYPHRGLLLAAWAALLALGTNLLIALTEFATQRRRDMRVRYHSRLVKGVSAAFSQTLLRLWFLPYEAWISVSAAATSLWRMLVSHRNLLEWETSAQSEKKKRGIIGYYSHMWLTPVSGAALMVFSGGIFAKTAGLIWIFAPLAALALALPAKKGQKLSTAGREYLMGCAEDIWSYFERFCSPEDNWLPPDNFQEQPPVGIAHRTSPTNIGLALVSALCAVNLGIDGEGRAFVIIENMLTTLEKLPKAKGHLMNWYDTRTLRPLEPKYISTVDSGNLYASLLTLKNGLRELGRSQLAERVGKLMEPMDFSVFYDSSRRLFRIGIDLEKNEPSPSHYDLMASEARLTSYLAVAKGDVPRRHWRRLSRAMRSRDGYMGMASWTGTMFEYLMPSLFLPMPRNSLMYESAKYCLYVQKRRQSADRLWGISESAFFSLDPALNYRYKAHGCGALALKRGQNTELVISPYSSFLALAVEPTAAIRNLRRLEESGARGRFGFIEAIDFTPSRCRGEKGEFVRCFMSHHLGMSMLAISNCISDGSITRLFMASPEMHAYRSLLEEKLPVNAAVLKLSDGDSIKTSRTAYRQWMLRGVDIDFENPHCAVLSNGRYNILLSESGISSATDGEMLIYRTPLHQLGEGHGAELYLETESGRFSLLPEPNTPYVSNMWELSESSCAYTLVNDDFQTRCSIAAAGGENGELRLAEIRPKRDFENARLVFAFEPVLADANDYVNHPAYWRLGIEAHTDGNCLVLHRLHRGHQQDKWLCLVCDRKMSLKTDKSGSGSYLSSPFVTASAELRLRAGETVSLRFAVCVADRAEDAYTGAQHMLAIGPAEYGIMPSACAALTGMDAKSVGGAMEMIRNLWFIPAKKPLISKEKLWPHGISGDLPLICCPAEYADRENVEELTKQFCLLRSCGIYADLVFLTDEGGEYNRPVYSAVRDTLSAHGLEALIGVHGGVRILPLSAADAIVRGSAYAYGDPSPARRVGTKYIGCSSAPRKAESAVEYDYDKDGSFVFYVNHSLPSKAWSNMLTNGSFGYLATDCGSGNMWYRNAREMRINRWTNDPLAVTGPETLEYVCDSGRYSLFAADDGIPCRVRYGFGFAAWEKAFGSTGIKCTAFVPSGIDARIIIIEVKGEVTGQIAWKTTLQMGADENDYAAVNVNYVNSSFLVTGNRSPISGAEFRAVSSAPVLGWTGDYFSFLRGEMDGKTSDLSLPIIGAVFNAEPTIIIACGCCSAESLDNLCKPDNASMALDTTRLSWRRDIMKLSLSDADKAMSRYMSGWAAYQTLACRLMGRCSIYQSGGAIGFRDQLQDAVNLMLISPQTARNQIIISCEHQYTEGDVMHWWHSLPDGDKGVRTRCSDDLLWLPWALCEYVEKTGDTAICDERINYVNSPMLSSEEADRYETPLRSPCSESVLEHARRAVDCCYSRGVGAHGLLWFGSGDWNDGMDKVRGESVWLSWFFAHTVRRFSDLLIMLCKPNAGHYRGIASDIGAAADRAWDGAWYLRGYWPDGELMGSHRNTCCRIDSIAQSWAAMCVDASNSRLDSALDSALGELYDRENRIVKLFTPPFYGESRDPGYIQSYGPGFRENGGQYTHAAIWLAMACLRRGRIDDGYAILRDILPGNHDIRRYMAEPFVIPADVYSCTGHSGEAGWTWYTGSAGWYFRVVCEDLLGLKLWSGSLYIRPALPEGMPPCTVLWTDGHGRQYTIVINGEDITLDGEKYDGKGIPYM